MKNQTCFHSNWLISICLVHNIWQKPLKMSKKSYLTLIFKFNMISKDFIIFHDIYEMDLHIEPNDGLSFKIIPSITLVIGVYFSRVCHWGPCSSEDWNWLRFDNYTFNEWENEFTITCSDLETFTLPKYWPNMSFLAKSNFWTHLHVAN